jgi:hypothetical protein
MRRRKRQGRDERKAAVLPPQLDGDNEDEMGEGPQYKKLNNSTIMPLKYSRYINDN